VNTPSHQIWWNLRQTTAWM